MEASKSSMEAFTQASTEAFIEASTAFKKASMEAIEAFMVRWKLPRKKQVVQGTGPTERPP